MSEVVDTPQPIDQQIKDTNIEGMSLDEADAILARFPVTEPVPA